VTDDPRFLWRELLARYLVKKTLKIGE
jgi:hypothetical protein